MYEYLVGILIMAVIWALAFIPRKDLRRPMIWSGIAYIVAITVWFFALRSLFWLGYIDSSITPGYWHPDTLFGLGKITGGYAIEDVLFMFFAGGIATFIYEYFFKIRINIKKTYKHHIRSPLIGLAGSVIFALIFKVNLMYSLIVFGFIGAIPIWIERKDLIRHSLMGGLVFTILYFLAFRMYITIFPDFIARFYNLKNMWGIMFLGVPIEELLYALSFGLLWSPIYEYEHGEEDIKI